MAETVYILTNQEMPGLVKVGKTNGDLATRIRQLFQTGVPLAFELFFACEVANAALAEQRLHDAFSDRRRSAAHRLVPPASQPKQTADQLFGLRPMLSRAPARRSHVSVVSTRAGDFDANWLSGSAALPTRER
jgi:T5orf172 domain